MIHTCFEAKAKVKSTLIHVDKVLHRGLNVFHGSSYTAYACSAPNVFGQALEIDM